MDFHAKPKLKTLDSLLLTIKIINILLLTQDRFSLLHNLHIQCRLALLLMTVNLMICNAKSFMEPGIDSFCAFLVMAKLHTLREGLDHFFRKRLNKPLLLIQVQSQSQ